MGMVTTDPELRVRLHSRFLPLGFAHHLMMQSQRQRTWNLLRPTRLRRLACCRRLSVHRLYFSVDTPAPASADALAGAVLNIIHFDAIIQFIKPKSAVVNLVMRP